MNWSGIVQSLLSPRSIVNAIILFFACYGVATGLHLPHAWLLGLVAVIGNQIGLHQQQPGA